MAKDINIKLNVKLASSGYNDQGTAWDDGCHGKIEKIVIGYSSSDICSFQVVYSDGDDNSRVLAPCHGATSCLSFKMITVTEPIVRIYGIYSSCYTSSGGINYLDLSHGGGSYCRVGGQQSGLSNYNFTLESDSGFTGFHGRADGNKLKALGAYVNSTAKNQLK